MGDRSDQAPSWRGSDSGRRLVLLVVGMILLAGVPSAGATLWLAKELTDSYDRALKESLEEKGSAYAVTATAFISVLGPDAFSTVQAIIDSGVEGSVPSSVQRTFGDVETFQVWAPDPSSANGYQLLGSQDFTSGDPTLPSEDILLQVVQKAAAEDAAAAVDEHMQIIIAASLIPLDETTFGVVAVTLSAEDEFAFFSEQRSTAYRDAILVSIVVVGFVSIVGIVLSLAVSRHLVSRAHVEEALREQARRDLLTGALNHAAIVDELSNIVAATGDGAHCAVVMADIDGMKATNDTFGHQMGDIALQTVARALATDGAVLGRYGGDEFVAILPGADLAAAERYREHVSAKLAETTLTDPRTGAPVPVLASIGLAVYPDEAETVVELIKLSDIAMYSMRRHRALPPDGKVMPTRSDDEAARAIGELVPLLTAPGRMDDKLNRVVHRLCVNSGYDVVSIQLYAPEAGGPAESYTVGSVGEQFIAAWDTYLSQDDVAVPVRQQLEATKRPLIIDAPQTYPQLTPELREILQGAGIRSGMVAPMLWDGRLIGSIAAGSRRANAFGPRDAQALSAIAAQVIAIVRLSATAPEPASRRTRKKRAA